MKKSLLFITLLVGFTNTYGQVTIFKETFGTTKSGRDGCTTGTTTGFYDPAKNERFADHDWNDTTHIWLSNITYSQTSDITTESCDNAGTSLNIRTNNPSTYTTASANGNLYFNANLNNSFLISGINTLNYSGVTLSFGIFGKNKADVHYLKLEYDSGAGYTQIATTEIAALSTGKGLWLTVSGISLPSVTNLSLKFSSPNTNSDNSNVPIEIRLDDIKITGTSTISGVTNEKNNDENIFVTKSGITLQGFTSGNVEIFNVQGKKVFCSDYEKNIRLSLPKGLYIVRIGSFVQKIVF